MVGLVRQLPFRGKGRMFSPVIPRSGLRDVAVWGDFRMTLDLADVVQRQMFLGCFGFEISSAVRRLLPPGGRFLDVGAHAGYFTLLAAHIVGPDGHVLAIEPNPAMFAALRSAVERNRVTTVRSEPIALGDSTGQLRLYLPPASELRAHNVTSLPQSGWTPFDVPCRRLDDCLVEWKLARIDLMKMDVEGAEPRVVAGGREALAAGAVRHLIVEVNGPRLTEAGSSPHGLVTQLHALGFRPAKLWRGRAVAVPVESWDLDPAHEYDRLFIHQTVDGH
jgi:FkbM family methyltransferase